MKLAIMQPYFFPYIGYFQLINSVDKYILYDNLAFIKEAWINRNYILNKSSYKKNYVIVPLEKKSSNKKISEIKIFNHYDWRKKILNALYLNYNHAINFDQTYILIEKLVNYETEYLSEFNKNSIIKICDYLQIKTKISCNEGYFNEVENLIAQVTIEGFDREKYPTKTLRILEFCKRERANIFYNAIGGQNLYSKELFKEHNVLLGFIKTENFKYKQHSNLFINNLSIIDVMMFNPKNVIKDMLNEFNIV
ncbi:MAG: WbqC family protein [Bacteroidales bacterium]|nr:WbqC family protein [Bacteroidales bacterium]